ncbi:DUF302 domain-containing protein [Microaerobacter geothermalis]|uniref:DUF302 domain-containing protein n=1 Tax=Microaerobacter geothermalis TaxID=674972 RepID=UPI001F3C6D8D|nr:DUF302 domain-containing protein [Microaerobacter geothermalis]MCF6094993.1 DUF302 domain-containing protein [Microaerobacter geothermalis]
MFHYTVSTTKEVDEAVEALESSLKDEGFGVLWQLDIPSKLKEKGVDYDNPYRVLEVCNPHEAKKVLSHNLHVGYFLPCKIVVYKDQNETKIGLPKPTHLIGFVDEESQFLQEVAQDVEKRLIKAIDQVK